MIHLEKRKDVCRVTWHLRFRGVVGGTIVLLLPLQVDRYVLECVVRVLIGETLRQLLDVVVRSDKSQRIGIVLRRFLRVRVTRRRTVGTCAALRGLRRLSCWLSGRLTCRSWTSSRSSSCGSWFRTCSWSRSRCSPIVVVVVVCNLSVRGSSSSRSSAATSSPVTINSSWNQPVHRCVHPSADTSENEGLLCQLSNARLLPSLHQNRLLGYLSHG